MWPRRMWRTKMVFIHLTFWVVASFQTASFAQSAETHPTHPDNTATAFGLWVGSLPLGPPAKSAWTDWVPLISTALGGALAVLGGFMSQLKLQKLQQMATISTRVADKLEEVGQLTSNLWLSCEKTRNFTIEYLANSLSEEPPEQFGNKILLLVRLYEPSLRKEAQAVADAEESLHEYRASCLAEIGIINDRTTSGRLKEIDRLAAQKYDEVCKTCENFNSALDAKFSEYRLVPVKGGSR